MTGVQTCALPISREVFILLFGQVDLGVQFIEVSFVEPSGDGFVDIVVHGALPERLIFLRGIETDNSSRAGDDTQSVG